MKLVQAILMKNPCFTAGREITVKGLMLHSVGCPQPKASAFINSWNSELYRNACVHAFVDAEDGTVYKTLPWNHRGWHCGSGPNGSGNDFLIGVEMCEPACIRYTEGAGFTCSDLPAAKACAKRTYEAAVELFAMLCRQYYLNPLEDGVIISHKEGCSRGIASNHGDPEHLWIQLKMGYTMDTFRRAVKEKMEDGSIDADILADTKVPDVTGLQASSLKDLSETEVIARVGSLFSADQKSSGILASVSLAQFILESGYGKSELAQNANNCFGMKKSLSGNTWPNSAWDGSSIYTKQTKEQNPDGSYETVTADFRKYPCVEKSIADHSAYLLGAMNGSRKRYEGIAGMTDYKAVVQLIRDGGYATSLSYVQYLCSIIERWQLTQYDAANTADGPETTTWYRVRKSWGDVQSQKGAFHDLILAKACADSNPGYSVFDETGKAVYTPAAQNQPIAQEPVRFPYKVKVAIDNLNIRKGPGTNYPAWARPTGIGIFTIVDEADGPGATRWGLLKSYKSKRNGWISLNYTSKL